MAKEIVPRLKRPTKADVQRRALAAAFSALDDYDFRETEGDEYWMREAIASAYAAAEEAIGAGKRYQTIKAREIVASALYSWSHDLDQEECHPTNSGGITFTAFHEVCSLASHERMAIFHQAAEWRQREIAADKECLRKARDDRNTLIETVLSGGNWRDAASAIGIKAKKAEARFHSELKEKASDPKWEKPIHIRSLRDVHKNADAIRKVLLSDCPQSPA